MLFGECWLQTLPVSAFTSRLSRTQRRYYQVIVRPIRRKAVLPPSTTSSSDETPSSISSTKANASTPPLGTTNYTHKQDIETRTSATKPSIGNDSLNTKIRKDSSVKHFGRISEKKNEIKDNISNGQGPMKDNASSDKLLRLDPVVSTTKSNSKSVRYNSPTSQPPKKMKVATKMSKKFMPLFNALPEVSNSYQARETKRNSDLQVSKGSSNVAQGRRRRTSDTRTLLDLDIDAMEANDMTIPNTQIGSKSIASNPPKRLKDRNLPQFHAQPPNAQYPDAAPHQYESTKRQQPSRYLRGAYNSDYRSSNLPYLNLNNSVAQRHRILEAMKEQSSPSRDSKTIPTDTTNTNTTSMETPFGKNIDLIQIVDAMGTHSMNQMGELTGAQKETNMTAFSFTHPWAAKESDELKLIGTEDFKFTGQ